MEFVDFLMWFFWGAGVVFVAYFFVGFVTEVVKAIKDDVSRKEDASCIMSRPKRELRTEYATLKAIEKCISVVGEAETVRLLEEIYEFLTDEGLDEDFEEAVMLDDNELLRLKKLRHGFSEEAVERKNNLGSDYQCLCPTDCIAGIDKRYACPLWNDCSDCEFLSEIETVEE